MKLKRKLAALAVTCCTLLSCFPVTAFAYSDDSAGISYAADETASSEDTAVIDRSGTADETTEGSADATGNPFTTDGNGQLQDQADSSQNKIFYTITTKNNNTFFLIIDKDRSSNNVYMLSMIDEADLAEFTEDGDSAETTDSLLTEEDPLLTENETTPDETPAADEPQTEESEEPTQEPEKTQKGSASPLLFALIGALAVAVLAGYYFLKIRPKKEMEEEEDETAYGEEDQPDDTEEEEIDEPEEDDTEATAQLPDNPDENQKDSDSIPFQDYPDPDDYPDSESEPKETE